MSPPSTPSPPMHARSADPTISAARATSHFRPEEVRHADPEAVLDQIRSLLTDDFFAARELALAAAARFPQHEGIQNASRILNDGKSTVSKRGPRPSHRRDFEWLRNPPESVRGKWVALVGGKLVDSAKTLAELADSLRSHKFPTTPLVHRID